MNITLSQQSIVQNEGERENFLTESVSCEKSISMKTNLMLQLNENKPHVTAK